MRKGFWKQLKKPILALAPMASVTDAAFRRVIAKYGKPDVMWTEFVSCDGLCSKGREKLLIDFMYHESERPIVAQIFGATPEHFYQTAQLIQELGFDGIDINMGCPVDTIQHQGAGAILIQKPELAKQIIRETMRGAGSLPVSIKTRLGYNRIVIEEWLPHLLETEVAAITIHGRTRKEMSKVPAHWDMIGRAAELASDTDTLILGNGDVATVEEAKEKCAQYGVDGVMIGRGIFGNPWLFAQASRRSLGEGGSVSIEEKLRVLLEHIQLFDELFSGKKPFEVMKKHVKAYISGFDGAKELRVQLMETHNVAEMRKILRCSDAIA